MACVLTYSQGLYHRAGREAEQAADDCEGVDGRSARWVGPGYVAAICYGLADLAAVAGGDAVPLGLDGMELWTEARM